MTSHPEKEERLQALFEEAADLGPEERAALLEKVGAEDAALGGRLERLLGADADASRFFAVPPVKRAAALDGSEEPGIDLLERQELGPYRLIRELGRGGQGIVFLAEDQRLGRKVALKLLPYLGLQAHGRMERFRREAEAASRMDEQGVCTIYEHGVEDGIPYIAMRYVEGETLARQLRAARDVSAPSSPTEVEPGALAVREGTTPITPTSRLRILEVLRVIEQVARTLHSCHEENIVHRDIKPGNIMLTHAGEPVVLDFGLARLQEEEVGIALTGTGDILGTPAYMSPEQIRADKGPVDSRTDIYSLGVVLYECLTLKRPFDAPTREGLYTAILIQEPANPCSLNPALPRDLLAVLETALTKELHRRYQTAEALADDLQAVREGRPVSVRALTALGRLVRAARRRPAIATVVILVALGAPTVAGLGGFLLANWESLQRGQRAEELELVEEHLEAGFLALGEGDLEAALHSFRAALEPGRQRTPEAVAGLALALARQRNHAGALAELDRNLDLVTDAPGLEYVRADILRRLGRSEEAEKLLEEVGPPRDELGYFLRATRGLARGRRGAPEAVRLLTLAIMHAKQPRALYFYERAAAAGNAGDRKAAEQSASVLLARWPDSKRAQFKAGMALRIIDAKRATAAFRKAVELDPGYYHAWNNLATALNEQKKFDEALEAAREAVRLAPRFAIAHRTLAAVLSSCGETAEELAALESSLELEPDHAPSLSDRGGLLHELGRHDMAEEAMRRAVSADPKLKYAWSRLGMFLLEREKYADAVPVFKRCVALDKQNAFAWCNLGIALRQVGRFEEALKAFEKGHELGKRRKRWRQPSAQWINQCKNMVRIARRVEEVLAGKAEPLSAAELVELALVGGTMGHNRFAVGAMRRAFEEQPELAQRPEDGNRLFAARVAARAAAGGGGDVQEPTSAEQKRWRAWALEWLRADLVLMDKRLEQGTLAKGLLASYIDTWLGQRDFDSVRDRIEQLPADEQAEWNSFWQSVRKRRARLEEE